MLRTLRIRNLAVIEDLRIDFEPGLNVLTGETGAGKSILLDALGLAVGDRADSGAVRTGADRAVVEAVFEPPEDEGVETVLRERGIGLEDGLLIVRREVSGTGGGRAFLNDSPCTVAAVREVCDAWVELLGQNQHHGLRAPAAQLALLDESAGLEESVGRVRESYDRVLAARDRFDRLRRTSASAQERADLLRARIRDIDAVGPRAGEREALERERRMTRHAARVRERIDRALAELVEHDDSAAARVAVAEKALEDLVDVDGAFEGRAGRLRSARAEIEDVAASIGELASSDEFDATRLDGIEERLVAIERLALRFGETEEDILRYRAEAERELAELDHLEDDVETAAADVREAESEYVRRAVELGRARREAAGRIPSAVESALRELAMEKARFDVRIETVADATVEDEEARPVALSPTGAERAVFLLSTNPGESLQPLARVASGGELSRALLALHGSVGTRSGARVLVFDEVDAGVGGSAADAVGRRLATLARGRQVLCVTHLPQVAAYGDRHYSVVKEVRGGRTRTSVRRLEAVDRVEELARMLGGRRVSDASRRNAADLLDGARRARRRGGRAT